MYESIDAVFDAIFEGKSLSILDEYLEGMPLTRNSTEEIMNAIKCYDLYPLYMALLKKFFPFLSKNEIRTIVDRFERTFDIKITEMIYSKELDIILFREDDE